MNHSNVLLNTHHMNHSLLVVALKT